MKITNENQKIAKPLAQNKLKEKLKSDAQVTYIQLCKMQKEGMKQVWNNPNELTPQEACDALGKDCVSYFQAHGWLTELIYKLATASGIKPDITLPDREFVMNSDGTVTIGAKK